MPQDIRFESHHLATASNHLLGTQEGRAGRRPHVDLKAHDVLGQINAQHLKVAVKVLPTTGASGFKDKLEFVQLAVDFSKPIPLSQAKRLVFQGILEDGSIRGFDLDSQPVAIVGLGVGPGGWDHAVGCHTRPRLSRHLLGRGSSSRSRTLA